MLEMLKQLLLHSSSKNWSMLNRLNLTDWWCEVLDLAQEQAHQGGVVQKFEWSGKCLLDPEEAAGKLSGAAS